jgi:hypothetical protein
MNTLQMQKSFRLECRRNNITEHGDTCGFQLWNDFQYSNSALWIRVTLFRREDIIRVVEELHQTIMTLQIMI